MNTFPIDWNEWCTVWDAWISDHINKGTIRYSSYEFPDKNFMADSVLGVFGINNRNVELSEVTFSMNLDRRRYVGVTYGTAAGLETPGLFNNFADLEKELGIDWHELL